MNKSKFLVSVALVLIASMILASCAPAATAVAPEPPVEVQPTEAVVQPTEAAMEPTQHRGDTGYLGDRTLQRDCRDNLVWRPGSRRKTSR